MDDKKNRILDFAWKTFMSVGYSSVSMYDIAHGCGVGKATVYKFFSSKEALLLESIEFFAAGVKLNIDKILADTAIPPAEKLESFMKPLLTSLSRVSAATLDDIHRNAPKAYDLIAEKRREMIFENITKIITDGKRSNVFRSDVDTALVAHIIIGAVSHITKPEILSAFDYTPAQILRSIADTVINGCRTAVRTT